VIEEMHELTGWLVG